MPDITETSLVTEILDDVKRAKLKGRNCVFKINMEVSDNEAKHAKKFLEDFGYIVNAKKCITCKQSWSFAIYFNNMTNVT